MHDSHLDSWFARVEYSTDGRTWLAVPAKVEPGPDGQYHCDWALPPEAPPRILIRVTGRDGAGNHATASTADKMVIDLVAPAGKLTGVRPIEAEVGPAPREVNGRPTVDVLRTVLPALLSSPVVFPRIDWSAARFARPAPSARDYQEWWSEQHRARLQSLVRASSAKEWVEWVTNTTVLEETARRPTGRRTHRGDHPSAKCCPRRRNTPGDPWTPR